MAVDRKISELLELTSPSPDDLLLIIDNPNVTPIPNKIQLSTLFNTIRYITINTALDYSLVNAVLSANVAHVNNQAAAGQFVATKGAAVTGNAQFGVVAQSILTANAVIGTFAGAFIASNPGPASGMSTNSIYGLIVHNSQTGTRASAPAAFIGIGEESANTQPTQFLLDVGRPGFLVTGNVSTINASAVFSNASRTTITAKLRIRVNGTAYWICLSSAV